MRSSLVGPFKMRNGNLKYLLLAEAFVRFKLAFHLHEGGNSNPRQDLNCPILLFVDDNWRPLASGIIWIEHFGLKMAWIMVSDNK